MRSYSSNDRRQWRIYLRWLARLVTIAHEEIWALAPGKEVNMRRGYTWADGPGGRQRGR